MILEKAVVAGFERLSAWADLMDRINVFPVADGDTGRNLLISLAPLRNYDKNRAGTAQSLLLNARGNSGNIAARFFSHFLQAESLDSLGAWTAKGKDAAWSAVNDPKPGTMLTVFDALTEALGREQITLSGPESSAAVISRLEKAVASTTDLLPKLKEAGVVDSGALGMFLFFEGFFLALHDREQDCIPATTRFKDRLAISSSYNAEEDRGYCIDMVLRMKDGAEDAVKQLRDMGESVVILRDRDCIKVHLHTDNRDEARKRFEGMGQVLRWSDDDIGLQVREFRENKHEGACHIVTDAAGSVTRDDARRYGFTLLDSYILAGDMSMPETHFPHDELYGLMRKGVPVSTSQASVFERHQHYSRLLTSNEKILYLCVGSVFTGNYSVVMEWKKMNDPGNRLRVLDTGSASGRLGIAVLAAARRSEKENDFDALLAFVLKAVDISEEYLFLDRLTYLARGGRMSKTGAFFGDLLNMKPVVSPGPEGAIKAGVVRNQEDQVSFALERMKSSLDEGSSPFVMLQYTDNREYVDTVVRKNISELYPGAEIIIQPLSLTTGVHTGPGTWAIAFLPGSFRG